MQELNKVVGYRYAQLAIQSFPFSLYYTFKMLDYLLFVWIREEYIVRTIVMSLTIVAPILLTVNYWCLVVDQ